MAIPTTAQVLEASMVSEITARVVYAEAGGTPQQVLVNVAGLSADEAARLTPFIETLAHNAALAETDSIRIG